MNILNSGMPSRAPFPRALCLRALLGCMAAMAFLPPAAQTQKVATTVTVGGLPSALAVNPVTNKIYVANGPITVITLLADARRSIPYSFSTSGVWGVASLAKLSAPVS